MGNQSSIEGIHSPDWESASRPSKTNPSASQNGGNSAADRLSKAAKWWHAKNEIVDEFIEIHPAAHRPISVRDTIKLREDATSERHDDGYRAKTWSSTLRAFLGWYNGYRRAHLRFRDPNGELVRAQMLTSHHPQYGDVYYAKLKALERQVLKKFDDPHVVMLSLTGSTATADGGYRCPADHLREIVEPFGKNVRTAVHRALNGKRWEYAKVLEHHKSGYGHMHVAVFVDGKITERDFHSAIDAHLTHCSIAGKDAHDYYSPNPETRPISVNQVDPSASLKRSRALGFAWLNGNSDTENIANEFGIGNLSSYIAEYIGSNGKPLFERELSELAFRAVSWATSTQRVTFSPGANELISEARDDLDDRKEPPDIPAHYNIGTSLEELQEAVEDPERSISDYLEGGPQGWTLEGVGVVDDDGEECHEIKHEGVHYVKIRPSEHLDPPNVQPPDRPNQRLETVELVDYCLQ